MPDGTKSVKLSVDYGFGFVSVGTFRTTVHFHDWPVFCTLVPDK